MKRASQIRSVGHWNANDAVDRVVLDTDERHRRRTVLTGGRGIIFLLDLPHATALRDGHPGKDFMTMNLQANSETASVLARATSSSSAVRVFP